MSTFAERLVEARKDKRVSSSQLCEAVGMSTQTLYNWENGIAEPTQSKSRERARSIAEYLGVNEAWLMAGAGVKTVAEKERLMREREERKATTSVVYKAKDKRQLEDIELVIKHLREMNLSLDEKKAIFLTLSEIRTDLEVKVMFGASA